MTRESAAIIVRSFMNRVYAWMAVSLLVSAGTAAWAVTDMQLLLWVAQNMWLCLIGAFAVLLAMGFLSSRLSSSALGAMLLVFAAIEGLALGPAVAVAGSNALGTALACTAGTFAVMSIFGATTRINLQGFGRFFTMVLIGLIIAMLVNLFVQNSTMDLAISGIGVLLFSALTAYDTQTIKRMIYSGAEVDEPMQKMALLGALSLYLDFINLFLYMLRLLGNRR